MVQGLKRKDRLDDVSEAVALLALVTGRLVDKATGGDVKEYAVAKLVTAHLSVLAQVARLTGPADAGDGFTAWLQQLSVPTIGRAARAPRLEPSTKPAVHGSVGGPSSVHGQRAPLLWEGYGPRIACTFGVCRPNGPPSSPQRSRHTTSHRPVGTGSE